jgi:hypothetical protein
MHTVNLGVGMWCNAAVILQFAKHGIFGNKNLSLQAHLDNCFAQFTAWRTKDSVRVWILSWQLLDMKRMKTMKHMKREL